MMVICISCFLLYSFTAEINEISTIAYSIVFCFPLEPFKAKNPKIKYADLYQVIWDHLEFALLFDVWLFFNLARIGLFNPVGKGETLDSI